MVIAAVAAPAALGHTSWSYILPYATVLAIASLGQMLVVIQGGIDLSTPGVMAAGGNLVAGVANGFPVEHPAKPILLVQAAALDIARGRGAAAMSPLGRLADLPHQFERG